MSIDSFDARLTAIAVIENMFIGQGDEVLTIMEDADSDDIIDGLLQLCYSMIDDASTEMRLTTNQVCGILRKKVLQEMQETI